MEGRRSAADEGASSAFLSLSAPAEAVHRSTEDGRGLLSASRPWIRREGWLLKEAGVVGTWHARYFVVSGEALQYYKEETCKLVCKPGHVFGCEIDSNIVTRVERGGIAFQQKALAEGDVVIGFNGEPITHRALVSLVDKARADNPSVTLQVTVLRPKAKVNLKGASVTPGAARKQGGHFFTLNPLDSGARRSKYVLVSTDEQASIFWSISLKEAIAAAAMASVKESICGALQQRVLALHGGADARWEAEAEGATAEPQPARSPTEAG